VTIITDVGEIKKNAIEITNERTLSLALNIFPEL